MTDQTQTAVVPHEEVGTKLDTPDLLKRLLRDHRFDGPTDGWPNVGLVTREAISKYLDALNDWLRPADDVWILGRIDVLLSHYYAPDIDKSVSTMVAEDWVATLNGLPYRAIAFACQDWIRTSTRRPSPSEILMRAKNHVTFEQQHKLKLERILSELGTTGEPEIIEGEIAGEDEKQTNGDNQ